MSDARTRPLGTYPPAEPLIQHLRYACLKNTAPEDTLAEVAKCLDSILRHAADIVNWVSWTCESAHAAGYSQEMERIRHLLWETGWDSYASLRHSISESSGKVDKPSKPGKIREAGGIR